MNKHETLDYRKAGVDIDKGDRFVDIIKTLVKQAGLPECGDTIGGFAGLYRLNSKCTGVPYLVACTDGVGTKLKIAFEMNRHDTIGIDLVAMSINDLLVTGAEPLFFLDYLATSKLDPDIHSEVIKGIIEGCRQSHCALLGGETAEMPGIYASGEYDLAGFAVGLVSSNNLLGSSRVNIGDRLLGIPSSGLHSNGYSLVRKVFENRKKFPLDKPILTMNIPLGNILLEPTRIYFKEIQQLLSLPGLKALAHITGGGITENLPRIIPDSCGTEIVKNGWPVHPIFSAIQNEGNISSSEMFRTFNMGIGLIAIIDPLMFDNLKSRLETSGSECYDIGVVTKNPGISYSVSKRSFPVAKTKHGKKYRIAIFGSGRGSNMSSICNAIDAGKLDAQIGCVISNNSRAFILERAKARQIPSYHISSFTHPDTLDQRILEILSTHSIDLICLAGYMKKIPSRIIQAYPKRILNIHPALLPAFGGAGMYGQRVHQAVIESGAKFSGASVHIVDEQYDQGEIIAQDILPVAADDSPDSLAEKILRIEHDLYWRAIANHLKLLEKESNPT
ncbi:phosphoribosylformylglycinamidine cyclo-ligase [bacterium]|nr:phosphoribosylformylglycinamidine cyclo-ligase [candidate division CSSED10-310 bacterium]